MNTATLSSAIYYMETAVNMLLLTAPPLREVNLQSWSNRAVLRGSGSVKAAVMIMN